MFGVDVLKRKEEAKIRHIEDILKNNLNKIRVSFSELFLSAEFRENLKIEKVNELHDRIKSIFEAKDDLASFEAHKENFEHFLQTGDIKTPLALKDEESQLYWGIALGYLAAHPEIQSSWDERHQASKLSDTTLWRRIESSSYMQKELKKHAYIIKRSVDNPDAKIIWSEMGYPNISYCFNRKNNVIIDDMLWTLVCGVDAAATAINHEIAHSQGTQFLESPKMEQLKLEQDALLKEVEEKSKAKDDEGWLKAVKLATRKRIEYQYRFRFLDELENMFANRYSVEFGGDYDKAHLNELETVINLGQKFIAPKNIKEAKKELSESAQKRIEHVKAIARNTFFMNNEILNKENELGSLHLYPELLDGYDEKGVKMSASEAFDEIKEICLKFENKQPSPVLKEDNPGMYAVRMKKLSKERSQLVDVFFDRFVAHHMEEIYKEAEKQIEESFKQAKMMQNQMQQGGQNGQGNQQQGGQQESQNGQQNGQQEGQNGQQNGQQEGQDGQQEVQDGQQEGQGGQQEGQDGQQEGQDGQQEGQDGQQEGQGGQQEGQGGQQKGQDGQQEGQGGQQEGQSNQGLGNQQGGQQNGQGGQNLADPNSNGLDPTIVDNNGYPSAEQIRIMPNQNPGEKNLTEEQVEQVEKKGANIDELAKEAEETIDRDELPQRGSNNQPRPRDVQGRSMTLEEYLSQAEGNKKSADKMDRPSYGGTSEGRKLYEGTFDKYMQRIAPLKDDIAKVRVLLEKVITQKKLDSIKKGSKQVKRMKTLTPEQGARTLDVRSHINLIKKIRTGDPTLSEQDFNRFNSKRKFSKDELIEKVELQESNFVILLDGSGSMSDGPLKKAIDTACILYEAARQIKEVNIFIYAMGDTYRAEPLPIAIPGMTTKEIGKNITSVLSSGCCDSMFPALEMGLKDVAEHMAKKPADICGFTHVFAITDGYNGDYTYRDGDKCLDILIKNNPQLTFDFFFTGTNDNNYMRDFLNQKKKDGSTQIGSVEGIFSDHIPLGEKISEILLKRIQISKVKEPQSNEVKRKLINDSIKEMSMVERTGRFYR